jgi:hypothetical protein
VCCCCSPRLLFVLPCSRRTKARKYGLCVEGVDFFQISCSPFCSISQNDARKARSLLGLFCGLPPRSSSRKRRNTAGIVGWTGRPRQLHRMFLLNNPCRLRYYSDKSCAGSLPSAPDRLSALCNEYRLSVLCNKYNNAYNGLKNLKKPNSTT